MAYKFYDLYLNSMLLTILLSEALESCFLFRINILKENK